MNQLFGGLSGYLPERDHSLKDREGYSQAQQVQLQTYEQPLNEVDQLQTAVTKQVSGVTLTLTG